ncbi:dyslexia-associated protein KIAA0319-like protein [Uranotaenia lowii]|uniref:dyslexia-associated protein KIAA0319-like protein n=1 Tax=Uranotaenia lowii TaxID=190385 RepID=UPI00247A565D|nr:dyslexia-associated protein KIAA0319-like protein [Uranotaenia lowii]
MDMKMISTIYRRNNIARIATFSSKNNVMVVATVLLVCLMVLTEADKGEAVSDKGVTASDSLLSSSGHSRKEHFFSKMNDNSGQPQPSMEPSQELKSCSRMLPRIFDGYAPLGERNAGNYTENPEATSLRPCVQLCCAKKDDCNTAFMFNRTCYHVKCVSNELCRPTKKRNLSTTLQMVLVNPVGGYETETSWSEVLQIPYSQENAPLRWSDMEEVDEDVLIKKIENMFMQNREYISDNYNSPYELGKYPASYLNDQYGDLMMDETRAYPQPEKAFSALTCNVNDPHSCPKNELCVRVTTSSTGLCACVKSYERNGNGECMKEKQLYAVPQTLTAQKLIMDNIHSKSGETDEANQEPTNVKKLTVSVLSKDVRLPNNEAILTAYVVPDEDSSGDKYTYSWSLISQPSKGDSNATIADQTKQQAKLSKLTEGLYRFKVTVTGRNGWYGEAYPNITVLPEQKINKPPEVIITPTEQTVKLPNQKAILDASASKDDDKIASYQWELVEGPLGYQPELPEVPTLELKDLTMPGKYTFKLTVIDSEKLSNSTTATIEVLKEIDYPPEANAGQNVIVYLPNNNVTLNGSLSKDDHGIVAWEWTKASSDQSKAVDMQNTRTPYLQLSNLEEGVYAFELKVTDSKNQSSTSIVHVFVKMPTNMPPVARAGANYTINLPQNWATLNGSQSSDDTKLTSWKWRQLSGPNTATILGANSSIANATALTIGDYLFELTVTDEGNNNATDRVKITVVQERNTPPVANAGGDQSVTLPTNAIILNGTRSSDDLGITSYRWTRESGSLAMGTIIDGSDTKPVLMVTNIVPGRYVFKLTVSDGQGLSGTDTVSIIVHPDPLVMSLVELTLTMEATVLTQSELDSLQQKLILLIGDNTARLHIRELKIEHKTGQVLIVFYVEKVGGKDKPEIIPALEVEKILKEKFWRDYTILGTSVSGIRTAICQNTCSGHGVCNAETRDCMCQSFWMPDIFFFWGVAEANCDWSILYVIIGVFIVFLILSGICWGITCLCRRSSSNKPRSRSKTQKYSLIGSHEAEMPSYSRTTLSDSETDSDVLFESRSKPNGFPAGRPGSGASGSVAGLVNGDVNRNGHTKYNTTRLGRRIKA